MDKRFYNKVIIITGAGGQFGRTGCQYFLEHGAKVAGIDLNQTTLEETKDAVKSDLFLPVTCDVTDASGVETAVAQVVNFFGRIDLLWNNHGYQGSFNYLLDYDVADFTRVMNINVGGTFAVLKAVAKQMKKQGGGEDYGYSIVNTASVAGLRGTPGMVAYATSKSAVIMMSITAAKELATHHIRVNAVSPALIGPGTLWERQNRLHAELGEPFYATDETTVGKNKIKSVPMKKLGSVDHVVSSVAFLLSGESSYTTGTNLVVDGGMSAGMK